MTYMVNGKQYIIVAVSGGNYSGEYIASVCRTMPERRTETVVVRAFRPACHSRPTGLHYIQG